MPLLQGLRGGLTWRCAAPFPTATSIISPICHACGACYVDCQFSPPHEFDVNVPQTLAIARAESYAAYAWPRAFAGLFARNGVVINLIAALSVAAFIFGFAAVHDRQVLFGIHTGAARSTD